MSRSNIALQRKQLSGRLGLYKGLSLSPSPDRGWIRAIREVLGMSARQLGQRLGLKQTHVTRLEQGEVRGTTSLKTLKKVADALDCVFVYGMVPRTSLDQIIRKQATKVAQEMVDHVSHSMDLEDQKTSKRRREDLVREATEQLIKDLPKRLWESE